MPAASSSPSRRGWRTAIGACALAALPIAWALHAAGFGVAVSSPLRDVARLVIAALAEEVLFRGGLLRLLRHSPPGRAEHLGLSGANLLTSLVFSVAHLWAHPALVAAAVFPVSIVLGLAYERSGTLRLPAALHLWFNLALYLASWWHVAG